MPPGDYAAVVAFVLAQNGACAGNHPLMSDPVADRDLSLVTLARSCMEGGEQNEEEQRATQEAAKVPQAYTWGTVLPSLSDDLP